MIVEEEYKKHIKDAWKFANEVADELADGIIQTRLALRVFDKCLSPKHYFLQNISGEQPKGEGTLPSKKQIKFAEDLGIENPEQYSKSELSDLIDKKKSEGN